MKTNKGMTRPLDSTGRIVLPKEMRAAMNIKDGDLLEISQVDNQSILLKTVRPPDIDEIVEALDEHAIAYGLLLSNEYHRAVASLEALKKGGSKMQGLSIEENNLIYCCLADSRKETLEKIVAANLPADMEALKESTIRKLTDMIDSEFDPEMVRNNYIPPEDE